MGHDATKVLMGSSRSSFKIVDNKLGTIAAGLIVRQKSDNTISIAAADGLPLGISFGKELSDIGRTNIVRAGLSVPVLLTAAFEPTLGAQLNVSDTTGKAIASGVGATAMNAVFSSGVLTGVLEDGTTANVALVDFQGGL